MKVCLPHNPVLKELLKCTHLCNTEGENVLEMDRPDEPGTTVKISNIMNANMVAIEDSETIVDVRKQMKLHKKFGRKPISAPVFHF